MACYYKLNLYTLIATGIKTSSGYVYVPTKSVELDPRIKAEPIINRRSSGPRGITPKQRQSKGWTIAKLVAKSPAGFVRLVAGCKHPRHIMERGLKVYGNTLHPIHLNVSSNEPMDEILQYLKNHGEKLDMEIAIATGISLTNVRLHLSELATKGEIMTCHLIRCYTTHQGRTHNKWAQ